MKKFYLVPFLILAVNITRAQDFVLKAVSDHFSISQNGQGINIYGNDIKDNLGNYFLKTNGTHNTLAWSNITGTPTTLAGYGITDAASYTASNGISLAGNNFSIGGATVSTPIGIRFLNSNSAPYSNGQFTFLSNLVSNGSVPNSGGTQYFNLNGSSVQLMARDTSTAPFTASSGSFVTVDHTGVKISTIKWKTTTSGANSGIDFLTAGQIGSAIDANAKSSFAIYANETLSNGSQGIISRNYTGGSLGHFYTVGMQVSDDPDQIGFLYKDKAYDGRKYDAWIPTWGSVKSRIDSAITAGATYTASNGITRTGNDFALGGNLTKNTNINLGSNNLTFTYTDPSLSGVNQVDWGSGWFEALYNSPQYGGSDLLTSWGQAQLTASGGGAYSNNSSILAVSVNNAGKPLFNLGGQLFSGTAYTYQQISTGIIDPSHSTVTINKGLIISDSIDGIGFQYNNDYSALGKTSDRWIPDWGTVKSYMGSQISGAAYTASNGITQTGNNFTLGGNVVSGNPTIALDAASAYYITGGSTTYNQDGDKIVNQVIAGGNEAIVEVNNSFGGYASLRINNSSGYQGMFTKNTHFGTGTGILIKDDIDLKGAYYDADYSANFVARSLIDKGYADAHYATTSGAAYTASNGITQTGNNFTLGGTLAGSTAINMSGNNITFTNNNLGSLSNLNSKALLLQNSTAATTAAYQDSPPLIFAGSSWHNSTSTAFDSRFAIQNKGTGDAGAYSNLSFYASQDGGTTWSNVASLNNVGDFRATSSLGAPYLYGTYAYLTSSYNTNTSFNDGTGYNLNPNGLSTVLSQASSQHKGVLFAPQMNTAARNAISGGNSAQYVTVTNGGSGYTSAPTVVFSGGGSGVTTFADGSAVVSGGQVVGVYIKYGGVGYTSLPTVSFTGGGGSGATAVVSNIPTGLTIYNTTTNQYEFYNGSSWVALVGGASNWSSITGKPTTLSGYGITDAVNTTTPQTIAGVKTFSNDINAQGNIYMTGNIFANDSSPYYSRNANDARYLLLAGGTVTGDLTVNSPINGLLVTTNNGGTHSLNITGSTITNTTNSNNINWGNGNIGYSANQHTFSDLSGNVYLSLGNGSNGPLSYATHLQVTGAPSNPNDVVRLSDLSTYTPSSAWSSITGKPTTLSGYGITDAVDLTSNQASIAGNKGFVNNITVNGTLGVGVTSPVAKVDVAAGTATAAPLHIAPGTNLTTPLSGSIENDGTNLYYTNSGNVRSALLTSSIASGAYLPITGGTLSGSLIINGASSGLTTYTQYQNSSTPIGFVGSEINAGSGGVAANFMSYVYGANSYSIWTNGLKRFNIDGSGNVLLGNTTPLGTATPITLSLGGSVGTNTPGNVGNLKLKVYDSGTDYGGIGVSNGLMEIQGFAGSAISFYTNRSTTPSLTLDAIGNATMGNTTNAGTATPTALSLGGTYGANAPGNAANLKLFIYDNATTNNRFGIGVSAHLMEFQSPANSAMSFFTNGSTTASLNLDATGAANFGGNMNLYRAGNSSNVVIGSSAAGKTSLAIATSADAGGYSYLQTISAQGSTYGSLAINPGGGNTLVGTTTDNGDKFQVSGNTSITGRLSVNHIQGNGSAPTIVAGPGAGTSPSVSVNGTDLGGTIFITTGTSPSAGNALIATITFNTAYSAAPRSIIIMPSSANAAALNGSNAQPFVPGAGSTNAPTTTTFAVVGNSGGLAASTVYSWSYMVIQ